MNGVRWLRKRVLLAASFVATVALSLGAVASCGSRTGLLEEESATGAGTDASPDAPDDVFTPDAADALPGIDVVRPDVINVDPCVNAGLPLSPGKLIYLLAESHTLYGFDPISNTFATIGSQTCAAGAGSPFSMAVEMDGFADVIFERGSLYRIDTMTAACKRTRYSTPLFTSGMTFLGPSSTLVVERYVRGTGDDLATLDPNTFVSTNIGPFSPPMSAVELTGTGNWRLFAFSASTDGGSFIAEVDLRTARVIARNELPGIEQGAAWAFAFWGGDFFLFTTRSPRDGSTVVLKFDPVSGNITQVATLAGDTVVAAGVSTCAPLEWPQ